MAREVNPELQEKLYELEKELEVGCSVYSGVAEHA
jgi:hypothetical protein